MVKRITESRLKTYAKTTGLISIPLAMIMIILMIDLNAITVHDYSKDIICGDTCFINITFTAKEDIFIYPMNSSWMIDFDNPSAIQFVQMYRTWGKGLRKIDLTKSCTGTWCGLSNAKDTRKFSYAFRQGKTYTIVY